MLLIKKAIYLFISLIPAKTLRSKLKTLYNRKFYVELNKHVINSYNRKIAFERICNCDYVAIGSSHCEADFNPDFMNSAAFNFGLWSADAYIMYSIYQNFIKSSTVKNVILFYDVFTRGSNNKKSRDFEIQFLPLKYLLGINYEEDNVGIKKLFEYYSKNKKFQKRLQKDFNGYIPYPKTTAVPQEEIVNHCASHIKIWNLGGQNQWIIKLIGECILDNKNVIFILSPAQKIYKNNMYESKILFSDILNDIHILEKSLNKQVKILNFYDTDIFENDEYWYDMDHLNAQGAAVFTKLIDKKLNEHN